MSGEVDATLEISPEAKAEIQKGLDDLLGGQNSDPAADATEPERPVVDDGVSFKRSRSIDDTLDDNGEPVAKDWLDPSLVGQDDKPEGEGDEEQQEPRPKPEPFAGDDLLFEAARRAGWSDEEAQEFMKQSPELAARTFERFRDAENNLTNQFAAIGRAASQFQSGQQPGIQHPSQQPHPQQQFPPQQQQATVPDPAQLAPPSFDEDRLKQLVDGDVYDAFFEPYQQWARQITADYNQRVTEFEARSRQWQATQDDALIKQTDNFFNGTDPSDGFGPGKPAYDLTQQEAQMRDQVLEHAKNLVVGKMLSTGENMNLTDALAQAYRAVTYNNVRQREASKLKTAAKNWSKGATLRPTQRKPAKARSEDPDAAAVAAVEKKLAEMNLG